MPRLVSDHADQRFVVVAFVPELRKSRYRGTRTDGGVCVRNPLVHQPLEDGPRIRPLLEGVPSAAVPDDSYYKLGRPGRLLRSDDLLQHSAVLGAELRPKQDRSGWCHI